jgi:hypothetical protein
MDASNSLPILNIDHHRFSEALRFVTESLTGQTSTVPFETRVKAIQDRIPLVILLTAAAGSGLEQIDNFRDGSAALDGESLRAFLMHTEVFCQVQGALAAFIVVGEEMARLEADSLKWKEIRQKAKPRKRKPPEKKSE